MSKVCIIFKKHQNICIQMRISPSRVDTIEAPVLFHTHPSSSHCGYFIAPSLEQPLIITAFSLQRCISFLEIQTLFRVKPIALGE